MHGDGEYIWPDKKKYIGKFEYDKRNGFGILEEPTGKRYEGFWSGDK